MIASLMAFMKKEMTSLHVGHDFDHSLRVLRNAVLIAESEECDMDIVKASALVHDYVDHKLFSDVSAQKDKLAQVLKDVGFHQEAIDHIFLIVDNISFSKHGVCETIEGKIVQDADRLDALGAIGIARTFAYGGNLHRPLYGTDDSSVQHFHDKLFKLKNLMNTPKGKVLAIERHEFMTMFLDQLSRELR